MALLRHSRGFPWGATAILGAHSNLGVAWGEASSPLDWDEAAACEVFMTCFLGHFPFADIARPLDCLA